jgi:hypothetical protein
MIPLGGALFNVSTPNYNPTPLPTMPNVVNNQKINQSFFSEFDNYFTLQFPFRTYLISAYNKVNEFVFKESKNEKVIIGEEGYYFFNETLDDYFKVNTLSAFELSRVNQVLAIQKEYLDNKGIQSYFVVVPNKATIYPEYMPSHLQPKGETSNLEQLSTLDLSMPFVELKDSLLSYKNISEVPLYHQKDSHWNNVGAVWGYTKILEKIQKEPLALLEANFTSERDWKSDLARMLYPSTISLETQYYYPLPNEFTFTRAIRTFEDVEIETINSTQQGSLFVFRDSFANALIPFLSESFFGVHYSRAFPYDYQKVDEFNPDAVVIEIAERNINWLLQQTPVLITQPKALSTIKTSTIKLDYIVQEKEINDMYFYNARFEDQKLVSQITAVKVVYDENEYDAFPIYQDDDVEDDVIEIGFSLYTLERLDKENMDVFVNVDNSWIRVE